MVQDQSRHAAWPHGRMVVSIYYFASYSPLSKVGHTSSCSSSCMQAWKESGFDVRVGETLIEGSILKSWEKKERSEAIQLQAELMGLVRGCDSVAELAMVVREVASHMSPETLVVSISRVAHLPLVR